MGIVGIRAFRAADVAAIVSLWNEAAPADPTTAMWFTRSILLDPDFDPAGLIVAEASGELAGCCYAGCRRMPPVAGDPEAGVGWIVFLLVHPGRQRQGIGTALIRAALQHLAARGCSVVRLASMTPHYIVPGLDEAAYPAGRAFLERSGFAQRGQVVAMTRSLLGLRNEPGLRCRQAELEQAGYRFGPPTAGELPQLIEFAGQTFSADWAEALRDLLRRPADGATPVLTVHRADQVLGFAAHGAYRGVAERFGPFGVAPSARGLGLGGLLLAQALADMRAEGLQHAWFLWTDEDSAAGRLYRRTGFSVSRRFSLWERPSCGG